MYTLSSTENVCGDLLLIKCRNYYLLIKIANLWSLTGTQFQDSVQNMEVMASREFLKLNF